MFDIEAAKRAAGIETEPGEKTEFGEYPRANRAKRANPESKLAPISTISTPPLAENEKNRRQRKCCFWQYKLNDKLPGFTQMGLMADSPVDAQKQLTEIYGRPVTGLRMKNKQEQKR